MSALERYIVVRSAVKMFIAISLLASWIPSSGKTPEKLEDLFSGAVTRFSKARHIGVDPQVVDDLMHSAGLFAQTFCYSAGPEVPKPCQETLYDRPTMDREVTNTLTDILESRGTTYRTLAARLATLIGHSMAEAGWPDDSENIYGVVEIGDGTSTILVATIDAARRTDLGFVTKVIAAPGFRRFSLGAPDRAVDRSIEVTSRDVVSINPADRSSKDGLASGQGGLIPVPTDLFCRGTGNKVRFDDGPLAQFNAGRSTIYESVSERKRHLAPFVQTFSIELAIDDGTQECDDDCRSAIAQSFVQAIALWRAACERCDAYAFAAFHSGSNWWIDSRLASQMRAGQFRGLKSNKDGADRFGMVPTPRPLSTLAIPYEAIPDVTKLAKLVCESASEEPVSDVRENWCKHSSSERFKIHLSGAARPCGSDDAMACADPGGGTRVSLELVTLVLPGSELKLGTGDFQLDVRLLALHEVGHWFGVPHTNIASQTAALDIMSEVYDQGPLCVSASSMAMLNNAIDDRWSYRLTQCAGWRLPRNREQTR